MMKLALTLEADSVNVRALNMGRIVVDIDGVNLAELMVNQNGFISQVADICYVPMRGHIRFCGLNAWGCQKRSVVWLSHLPDVMASVSFIWMPALNACRVYPLSTGRFCGLNAWGCQKRSVVWLSHLPDVMASVSFIWMPALNACRVYPLSTGNQEQHEIINHGNRTGYSD